MTTLTEFLLARIAEDEGQAQRQVRRVKAARDADVYLWPRGSLLVADSETTAVFSGAWRVLAECEAKRRLLKMHEITGEPEEQWLDSGIYGATGRTVYGCGDCDLAEDNMVRR